ncbi:MAG: envelope stress response membrane protein PspC [Novosphingobium sp.]
MNTPHTRFYRDKQNARIMGVCAGIADYTGVNVLWIRLAAVALVLMSSAAFILVYLVVGMVAPIKPSHLYLERGEQKFWQGVRQSPTRTAREVRARFRDIDRRLAEVEEFYVGSNRRLSNEIERLR